MMPVVESIYLDDGRGAPPCAIGGHALMPPQGQANACTGLTQLATSWNLRPLDAAPVQRSVPVVVVVVIVRVAHRTVPRLHGCFDGIRHPSAAGGRLGSLRSRGRGRGLLKLEAAGIDL